MKFEIIGAVVVVVIVVVVILIITFFRKASSKPKPEPSKNLPEVYVYGAGYDYDKDQAIISNFIFIYTLKIFRVFHILSTLIFSFFSSAKISTLNSAYLTEAGRPLSSFGTN